MRKYSYQKSGNGKQIIESSSSGRFIVDNLAYFVESLSAIKEDKVYITNDESLKSSTAKVILIEKNLVKWEDEDRNYVVIGVEQEMFNTDPLFDVLTDFISTQLNKKEITVFEEK